MAKTDYRIKIQQTAALRGISSLVHFTLAPNLPHIIKHGLLCRTDRPTAGLPAYTSPRLDGEDQAISVSISAINHRMFEAKRATSGRTDWIVLLLRPSILWTYECRFYPRNAARREMLNHRSFLSGPWAFNEMFSESSRPNGFVGNSYRTDTGIPANFTTYSDAEIQVLEPIPPKYVIGAWANDLRLAEMVQVILNGLDGPERNVSVRNFFPIFENDFDAWG